MKTKGAYRQGDVLLRRIDKIPAIPDKRRGLKAIIESPLILAKGEVSGHSHKIWDKVSAWETPAETTAGPTGAGPRRIMYIQTDKSVVVEHEEHKPLKLPKGKYEVTIQRQYEPRSWSQVSD